MQVVRRNVVALARKAKGEGMRKCEIAARLALPTRTLSHWQKHCSEPAKASGPRPRRATESQRSEVVATLARLGPRTGLPTLRALHPELTRTQLFEILDDFRRAWRKERRYPMTRLCWTTPGAVWAMDFTMPESLIDGTFVRVLVVRDLASGYTLLALPCMGEDSDTVLSGLQSLFDLYGAPLVLKSDNGGAFAETRVQALLAEKNVLQLFSPPYYPRYNGTCEAGIGVLKSRTRYLAELNLRPNAWSSSDLQDAVHILNEITRPWGHLGSTRAEVWHARNPVTDEQRKSLAELREAKLGPNRTVADEVRDQAITLEAAFRPGAGGRSTPAPGSGQSAPTTLSKHELASLERKALADALEQLGFLSYWRRHFTPPIKLKFRAKN